MPIGKDEQELLQAEALLRSGTCCHQQPRVRGPVSGPGLGQALLVLAPVDLSCEQINL